MKKKTLPFFTITAIAAAAITLIAATLLLTSCRAPDTVIADVPVEPSAAQAQSETTVQSTPKPTEQAPTEMPQPSPTPEQKSVVTITIDSKEIAQNIIDEPSEHSFKVYLPPSYYENAQDYPVVYFLEGHGTFSGSVTSREHVLNEVMLQDGMQEFIVVDIDGFNMLYGSFYANSPITGNWENHVVEEIVSYMDENFNTIADINARGICGFSMGGAGALSLALKHPDVFSAMYTVSPGAFDENGLEDALVDWAYNSSIMDGYGAAFSYDAELPFPHCTVPAFDGTEEDAQTIANWESGFGNLEQKVYDYLALNTTLNAIRIDVSETDDFTWIPNGCKYLHEILTAQNIPAELNFFSGGHRLPVDFFQSEFVTFFSQNLNQ